MFAHYVAATVSAGKVVLPTQTSVEVSAGSSPVKVHYDKELGGFVVWFPAHQYMFAEGLIRTDDAPVAEYFRGFLQCVAQADPAPIAKALKQIVVSFKDELQAAKESYPHLRSIVDSHSRWVIDAYVANVSRYPLVLHPVAEATIRDRSKARYTHRCHLAPYIGSDNGPQRRVLRQPLSFKAGQDMRLSFVFDQMQKDLGHGAAIREAFTKGTATVKLRVRVSGVAWLSRRSITTRRVPFAEPEAVGERER